MRKKSCFAILLSLCIASAIQAQDEASRLLNNIDGLLSIAEERLPSTSAVPDENAFTFSVRNNTGFTGRSVYVRKQGETRWGEDLLTQPLFNGQSATISLSGAVAGNFSIHMVDTDGDSYAKFDITISKDDVIRLGIGDFQWERLEQ